jgi:hypothetical protein
VDITNFGNDRGCDDLPDTKDGFEKLDSFLLLASEGIILC